MKKNKILCSILAIFVLLSFIGCGNTVNVNNSDKDNPSNGTDEIDYENYQSYSVRVRNHTSQNLLVFKGTPSSTTLNIVQLSSFTFVVRPLFAIAFAMYSPVV